MVIYPESFSVKPNTEATVGFRNLFNTTSQTAVNKNLTLLKGNYVFCSKNASTHKMHLSGTAASEEYPKNAEKNLHKTAVVIENIKNMDIDCGGSSFIMDGKMTHIYIKNCENLKIKNLNIETVLPNVHKLTVTKASPFYITFEVDSQSKFIEENGNFYWVGTDYKSGFTDCKNTVSHTPTFKPDNPFHIFKNGSHPLFGVASLKRISERVFNARFIVPKDFKVGQSFYIYPEIREEVGIFIEGSKNIELNNIKQTFNYGHGILAQNSENITLQNLKFIPNSKAEVDFCSLGDFLHFSMCRGNIKVLNSSFDGAGGNACSVHGINFKITHSHKDKMTVKFPHPQTYGFECIKDGDIIAFIDQKTLSELGRAKVLNATLRDEYFCDLVLTTYEPPIGEGGFIECVAANPNFEFNGNSLNRVSGCGVRCSTRARVRIEENNFLNTGEEGIRFNYDTSTAFEGGPTLDATIGNNAFMNCENSAIVITPDIRRYGGAVYKNITVDNNLFVLNNTHALDASSTENIVMKNNMYKGRALNGKWAVTKNIENILEDFPK